MPCQNKTLFRRFMDSILAKSTKLKTLIKDLKSNYTAETIKSQLSWSPGLLALNLTSENLPHYKFLLSTKVCPLPGTACDLLGQGVRYAEWRDGQGREFRFQWTAFSWEFLFVPSNCAWFTAFVIIMSSYIEVVEHCSSSHATKHLCVGVLVLGFCPHTGGLKTFVATACWGPVAPLLLKRKPGSSLRECNSNSWPFQTIHGESGNPSSCWRRRMTLMMRVPSPKRRNEKLRETLRVKRLPRRPRKIRKRKIRKTRAAKRSRCLWFL